MPITDFNADTCIYFCATRMKNTGLRNAPRSTSFNQKRKDVLTHYEMEFNIANITRT